MILTEQFAELPERSCVLLEQLRTIDRQRLQKYMGHLDEHTMVKIDHALKISVGLDPSFL